MNATSKIEAATLASAMAAAFGEIEGATKATQGQVGQQKYKYADLTSVIDAIKPALIKQSLFFTQHPEPNDKGVCIETVLHHAGGEILSLGKLFVPANKQDAQGFGSALTYARRYALVTAFGVPVEDDDGNAASKAAGGSGQEHNGGRAASPTGTANQSQPNGTNWGGRYPTKTALHKALIVHQSELNRLGSEGTFDDLDMYLTSPEYADFVVTAEERAPHYLEGPRPEGVPEEFIQTFALEKKARDLIALRGNVAG